MPLPDDIRPQAELLLLAYCRARTPETTRQQLRLGFRTRLNTMTLYVCCGPWKPRFPKDSRFPVAQFRYDPDERLWTLYWVDEHEQWHLYEQVAPATDLLRLIQEVDDDPSKVFFG